MTPCPRCARDNPPDARVCARCGTPLSFGEEPTPSRLDGELDLDRRSRPPGAVEAEVDVEIDEVPPAPEAPPRAAESGRDRSGWAIGARVDERAEEAEGEAVPDEAGPGLRPAPPARRLAAWAIDAGLVAAVGIALPAALLAAAGAPAGARPCFFGSGLGSALLLSEAFVAILGWVYATAAHALAGATLGKRIARIRVVGPDDRPPDPAVSAARSSWAILSLALAGVGFLPALVSPSRRALHDLLAGTRVVEAP